MHKQTTSQLRISLADDADVLALCEQLQLTIWGGGDMEVTPANMMQAVAHAGGAVHVAWSADIPIGMSLMFVAKDGSECYLHSHLLGVLPDYRASGIGWQLKMAQREFAIEQGLKKITWTFDPLESVNAHLNFAKLGVTARRYYVNFYGELKESISEGLDTDRLLVEWDLTQVGGHRDQIPASDRLEIEIPANIQAIKRKKMEEAAAWRAATRKAFQSAFAGGYVATDYLSPTKHRDGYGCYVLTKSIN